LGFRIVSFNIVDGPASVGSTTPRPSLLINGPLGGDDPALWTSTATAADIQAGAVLWSKRASLYDPLHDSLDGVMDSGAMNGRITAACADCHARNGYDLKYFNYSDKSIIARAAFHRLAAGEGAKIAAYIRSLNIPVAANARPWNPPYQQGPGLDAALAHDWAGGAGVKSVLEDDAQMRPSLFKSGESAAQVAAVTNRFGTLNMRELPIALQLPDWNQWLPKVHPLDAFDPSAATIRADAKGVSVPEPYFDYAYNAARLNPNNTTISTFRKNVEVWMGEGATCFTQTFNTGLKYRGNNGVIMKEVTLYPSKAAVIATPNCEAQCYDIALTERIETAKARLAAFISVKQWKMMRNAQLETGSQSVGKNTCISGTYESTAWYHLHSCLT
jgi:hypothetical protein